MLDDLRSYLQMASGLTEATTTKAREVVSGLLAQGLSLSAKAVPAPDMVGQVQELADDLVATSKNNREMLVGMIRAEVDRAVGRMGFVREDELAALRRHVQRLEKQIVDQQAAASSAATPAPDAQPASVGEQPPVAQETPAGEAEPAPAAPAPKKKKKVIVADAASEGPA